MTISTHYETVLKVGLKHQPNMLYYLDGDGHIMESPMLRGANKPRKPTRVGDLQVCREDGYLYFINRDGDIARVKMRRKKKR
jgi:hypothetical protein